MSFFLPFLPFFFFFRRATPSHTRQYRRWRAGILWPPSSPWLPFCLFRAFQPRTCLRWPLGSNRTRQSGFHWQLRAPLEFFRFLQAHRIRWSGSGLDAVCG